MNQKETEKLTEWVGFAYEVAEEALGRAPSHTFVWSNHMTSCAGMVQWRNVRDIHGVYVAAAPTIKLSVKIFNKAVEDLGIEEVCEQIYWMTLHELAHLYAGPNEGHGGTWREIMGKLGLDPQEHRYHKLANGVGLAPQELRVTFWVGRKIRFMDKNGKWHGAVVARHNPKNCKCWVAGYQSWNLPWTWIERALEEGWIE